MWHILSYQIKLQYLYANYFPWFFKIFHIYIYTHSEYQQILKWNMQTPHAVVFPNINYDRYIGMNAFVSECKIEFSGPNCSKSCIYPTYGLKCASECYCSIENCNFRSGCLDKPTSKSINVFKSIVTVCRKFNVITHVNGFFHDHRNL